MALIPPAAALPLEPSLGEKVGRGVDDTLMLTPRVVGAAGNAVKNTYMTGKNLLTRGRGYTAQASAEIVDAFTRNPFAYEKYTAVDQLKDGWGARRSKRFGNLWTGVKNFGKWTGNTFKKTVLATLKTGVYTLPKWAVGMTAGNLLHGVKDAALVPYGAVVDTADAGLAIGDQGKDKNGYGYTQVHEPKVISFAEATAGLEQGRKDRKARRKARLQKKLAELEKEDDASVPTLSPTLSPVPVPTPVPAAKKDAA